MEYSLFNRMMKFSAIASLTITVDTTSVVPKKYCSAHSQQQVLQYRSNQTMYGLNTGIAIVISNQSDNDYFAYYGDYSNRIIPTSTHTIIANVVSIKKGTFKPIDFEYIL